MANKTVKEIVSELLNPDREVGEVKRIIEAIKVLAQEIDKKKDK